MADRLVGCHSRLFLLLLLLTNLCVAVQEQQQQSAFEGNTILKGDGGQTYDWDLVIVIPSHITEFSRRCAVRDGWARQLRGHEQNNHVGLRSIKLLFTVGAHYPDNSTRDTAMAEMKQFDDIITLPSDFVDRYDALGTKVRLSFREAVDRLGRFRLVLKADTDSYVHVEKLLDFFDKENMWNGDPVYAGSFRHAPVMWEPEDKDHKWFDGEFTKMTGLTQYPWNAQGGGYVISYDLAKYLAHPPLQLKSWTHEDVGVGAWLMALDYRRIDMPVGFAAPECGCALDCVDTINDLGGRDLVIDHYVPPFLHRVRQRRMELFGDDCWVSSLSNTISPLAEKVIPVNNMCYSPMWLGGEDLQNEYALTPLQWAPEFSNHILRTYDLLPDHSDTRSGVCGIQFDWRPSSSLEENRCMVCRGSDGYDYDEFECGDPKSVVPAAVDSLSEEVDSSMLPSIFFLPMRQWVALEGTTDCVSSPAFKRERVTLAQCKYLAWSGHYSIFKWLEHEPELAGSCYVYNQHDCHREVVGGDARLWFLPTELEPSPTPIESSRRSGMIGITRLRSPEVLSMPWLLFMDLFRIFVMGIIVFIVAKIFFAVRNRGSGRSSSAPRGRSRTESFTQGRPGSIRFTLRKFVCKLFRDYHPVNSGFAV